MKTIADFEMPTYLSDFLNYAGTIKNKSPNTILSYFYDLRIFLRFILVHKKNYNKNNFDEINICDATLDLIKIVTLNDLYDYISFALNNRSNSVYARSRKIASIRSFFKYLTNKVNLLEYNPANELDSPNIRNPLPKYLNLEECFRLLNSIDGKYSQRDYTMILIFLTCGLRLSELVGININDFKDDKLRVVGKGNKERIVYLNELCLDAIKEYIANHRPKEGVIDKNALFISRNRKRIDKRTVEMIVKKFIEKSGLDPERYSTHKLRHTAATLMYRNGVDIRALQEILGHTNLGTTQIYTHLDDNSLREAMNSNPISKFKKK
jgi:integrase/recombinase XerD